MGKIQIDNRTLITLVTALLTGATTYSSEAQESLPKFGFPLEGFTAYTVSISAVLDHSPIETFCFQNSNTSLDMKVRAYTGELGSNATPVNPSLPCGAKSYLNQGSTSFLANGNYVFGTELSYDGHSGYDYDEDDAIIVAPLKGEVYLPRRDPITGSQGQNPWCRDHTFYIDHGDGWSTWYLHSEDLLDPFKGKIPAGFCASVPTINTHLGDIEPSIGVAKVGRFAMGSPTGVPEHLHFEVRLCAVLSGMSNCSHCSDDECNCIDVDSCKTVDPYGWEWFGRDPLSKHSDADALPGQPILWSNFPQPLIVDVDPVFNASKEGWDITITGKGFIAGSKFSIWHKSGYWNGTPTDQSVINENTIIGTVSMIESGDVKNIHDLLVKVKIPGGPRSLPYTLKDEDRVDDARPPESSLPEEESGVDCTFEDVVKSDWYKPYIGALCKRRIMTGEKSVMDDRETKTMRPNDPIKRAEFVKLIVETLDHQNGIDTKLEQEVTIAPFSDLDPENEDIRWFIRHAEYAKEEGLIGGVDGAFLPDQNLSRAEGSKIFIESFRLLPDKDIESGGNSLSEIHLRYKELIANCTVEENPICPEITELLPTVHKIEFADVADEKDWFYYYVYGAREAGVMTGFTDEAGNPTGVFGPNKNILRGEVAKVLCLTFFGSRECNEG